MSASIWAPGADIINVDAESSNLSQVFTAAAGQTLFTLTAFSYTVGGESVAVYRGGQRLIKGVDWAETSSTSITIQGITLADGETIEVVAVLGAASAASVSAAASAAAAEISKNEAQAAAASVSVPLGKAFILQDVAKVEAADMPVGTSAQRPSVPVYGQLRINSELNRPEWWNGVEWAPVGYGATGPVDNPIFFENEQIVTGNYTIPSGKNAMTAGPVDIANTFEVTVSAGSVWTVV